MVRALKVSPIDELIQVAKANGWKYRKPSVPEGIHTFSKSAQVQKRGYNGGVTSEVQYKIRVLLNNPKKAIASAQRWRTVVGGTKSVISLGLLDPHKHFRITKWLEASDK